MHSIMRVAFVIPVANGKAKVHWPVRHPVRNSRAAPLNGSLSGQWAPIIGDRLRDDATRSHPQGKLGNNKAPRLTSFDAFGILLLK